MLARRYLANLLASEAPTAAGDEEALHRMRIALTHLRSVIRLFKPMIRGPEWNGIKRELQWLNRQMGAARDLDVATARIEASDDRREGARVWREARRSSHRRLAMALRSGRHRRMVARLSDWIADGRWSSDPKRAKRRDRPVASYAERRLAKWEAKLIGKSRRLRKLDPDRRHRLRLMNKRLTCSIEALGDLLAEKRFSGQTVILQQLRKAQKCLGQLNDDERARELARKLKRREMLKAFRSDRQQRKLLRDAETAYRRLARLAT